MPPGLQNLKKVSLVGVPGYRNVWFSRLYKVALLPNLQTLHGHAVGYSSITAVHYDHGQRNLENLRLTTCGMDSRDLSILLQSSKPNSLKTFDYEVGDESVEKVGWQPY